MNNLLRGGGTQNVYFDIISNDNQRADFVTYSSIDIYVMTTSETKLNLVAGQIGQVIENGFVHYHNGTYQLGIPGNFLEAGKNLIVRFSGPDINPSVFIVNLINQRIAQ